jgi:hypothetical protein
MLHEDEDDKDEAPADTAALRRCRIVNMHTGAMLWIQLLSFEEYDNFLADTKGFFLFYCVRTETVRLFIPLTTAMAVFPGFSGALGLEGARAHYYWEHRR